jgi:glutaminyl-tRNA synthetase
LAGIENYSLLQNSLKKNINNNKSSLLFAQFILKYAPLNASDFDSEDLSKLYLMSLRSESSFVRSRALLNLYNLKYDASFLNSIKEEILKLKANPSKSTTERETEFIEQILNK